MSTPRRWDQKRGCVRQPGFTLIELLVVTGIIALLISMLLPSLSAARNRSKHTTCLARLKSIATTSKVYEADDPRGLAIPVAPTPSFYDREAPLLAGAYEWGGKSGVGAAGFSEGPTDGQYAWLSSRYGTRAQFGPANRPLNALVYPGGFPDHLRPEFDRAGAQRDTELELDLFRCPGDDGPPRGGHNPDWVSHTERSSYDHYGTSYAANTYFISTCCKETPSEPGRIESMSPYMRPSSRVVNASRTLLFEENIGKWAWACRRTALTSTAIIQTIDPGPTKAVRGWHGKDWTFNRAMVDGHAVTDKVYIEGTEDRYGYAQHYRTERVPRYTSEALFPGTDVWGFTVRGDGWQKDAFPGPPVPTGELAYCGCGIIAWTEGAVEQMDE